MQKNHYKSFLTFALMFFLAACSGADIGGLVLGGTQSSNMPTESSGSVAPTGPDIGVSDSSGGNIEPATGNAADGGFVPTETTDGSVEESTPESDGLPENSDALPTGSVEITFLKNENIVISAPDSNNVAYLQGKDLEAGETIKVTNNTAIARLDDAGKSGLLTRFTKNLLSPYQMIWDYLQVRRDQLPANRFYTRYFLGREQYDDQAYQNLTSHNWEGRLAALLFGKEALAEDVPNPCEAEQTTCTTVNEDGSVFAQLYATVHGDSFSVSYIDPTTYEEGPVGVEKSHENLLYVANDSISAHGLAFDGKNRIFHLAQGGNLQRINYWQAIGRFEVTSGEYENLFQFQDSQNFRKFSNVVGRQHTFSTSTDSSEKGSSPE